MEIPAVATAVLGILSSAKKMLISRKPRRGNVHTQVNRDVDVSGVGNQIVNVGSNATVEVHQSPSDDDSPAPLPKGAACPHLKPEFVGPGQYKAVGFWKWAKGYADMSVEGGGWAGTRACGFDCCTLASGRIPECTDKENLRSIAAYCIDGDPSKPGQELMDFWRSRNLLH